MRGADNNTNNNMHNICIMLRSGSGICGAIGAGLHKGHVRLELFDLKKTNFLAAHEVTHSLRRADRTGVSHHCGTVALRQKPHQTTQLCAISPVSRGCADTVELHV